VDKTCSRSEHPNRTSLDHRGNDVVRVPCPQAHDPGTQGQHPCFDFADCPPLPPQYFSQLFRGLPLDAFPPSLRHPLRPFDFELLYSVRRRPGDSLTDCGEVLRVRELRPERVDVERVFFFFFFFFLGVLVEAAIHYEGVSEGP